MLQIRSVKLVHSAASTCAWLLALAAFACSSSAPPPPASAPGAASAPSPIAVAPPKLPDPPPSPRDAKVAAALARIPAIAETVATIRHLPLKHPVPAAEQSQEDFRRYLDAEVKKDLPVEKAAQSVRALVRIGLLSQSIDLAKTVEDAMITQAGAYYDPDTKKFCIVLVPDDEVMLDVMSAHELTHALDDQYFDLNDFAGDKPAGAKKLSSDAQQARRFVAEGEATLVMIAYQANVAAHEDIFDLKNRRMEKLMVGTFAELDAEKVAKAAADNPALVDQMGPSLKASIEAMATIPPFILDPLFGAYTKGAAAVGAVRDAGGWEAVGELYKNPPESTEQMLHPIDKLITKRDHPVTITFAAVPDLLAGWTELDQDVVGELTMGVYFKNIKMDAPASRVTGWGGDRYVAYGKGDKVVGCWMTTWDTEKDARRFYASYLASLPMRFGARPVWTGVAGASGVRHPDGSITAAALSGKDVRIVDGADPSAVVSLFTWLAHSTKS